ncbi:MAG: hypothetical protein H5U38_07570 [Calditrichaeota bacterium]|nr:hypothetical protein [Calditrichota bacterium]
MAAKRIQASTLIGVGLLLFYTTAAVAQQGSIGNRATADPAYTGYAAWIKLTVAGPAGNNSLNDNFAGAKVEIDLNIDGDNNEATNPGDVYEASGDAGEMVTDPLGSGGAFDQYFYVRIKSGANNPFPDGVGYDTDLRPRVKFAASGFLRVGGVPIQTETGFVNATDDITPRMRKIEHYDDGTGHMPGSPGNQVQYDGYIDKIIIEWSEPMRTSNVAASTAIFGGLGSSVSSIEATGAWADNKHFVMWPVSISPNSGITPTLSYYPPPSNSDKFASATLQYAETHAKVVTDRSGPAIVSAQTKRATRRQALAAALAAKRIRVVFSEPVAFNYIQGTDFTVTINGVNNPVASIVSPTTANPPTNTYEFALTNDFVHEDVTGSISYTGTMLVRDVSPDSNYNGVGPTRTITDGILPNIVSVRTVDGLSATNAGANGWGYLDWVEVTFDHTYNGMDQARLSTLGFTVTGTGILTIGATGSWASATTFRIPLVATSPKVPNTDLVPTVTYVNPGSTTGLRSAVNNGLAENLLATDVTPSSENASPVQIIDGAGPALIEAYTAGGNRIRLTFSEKVNTAGWPTTEPAAQVPSRFKWFVGLRNFSAAGTKVFFTGLSGTNQDNVIYLNSTGATWTKTDSGFVNFYGTNVVYDVATPANGNLQWDDDGSIVGFTGTTSDVKVKRDNIAPILLGLYTQDFDADGTLDHYRFVFDPLSPIFPKTSFKAANWTIAGYDGPKSGISLNMNVYNPAHAQYKPTAINTFGDTVEAYISFNETTAGGPPATPYGGDTGDVPDVIVEAGKGFADWADNVMAALGEGLSLESDKAGPAIMSAKTISTTTVEILMSEKVQGLDLADFDLTMGFVPPLASVTQPSDARVLLTVAPYAQWAPTQTGTVRLTGVNKIYDDIAGTNNGNMQTASIAVIDATASYFIVSQVYKEGSQFTGVPFDIKVIAKDSHGTTDVNFTVPIQFAANKQRVTLPTGVQRLTNGEGVFQIVCYDTTSNLVITVYKTTDPGVNGSTEPIEVVEAVIDAPNTLTVKDYKGADGEGDQGGYVTLVWDFSQNHPGIGTVNIIDYYQIYRVVEGKLFHWGTVQATDPRKSEADSVRVVVPTYDNVISDFYVQAVKNPPPLTAAAPLLPDEDAIPLPAGYVFAMPPKGDNGEVTVAAAMTAGQLVSPLTKGTGGATDDIPPAAITEAAIRKISAQAKLFWPKVTKGIDGSPERSRITYRVYAHPSNAFFNVGDPDAVLLGSCADTFLVVNVDALRRFYMVVAMDDNNMSGPSNRVGHYGFALNKGETRKYTHISLPLIDPNITDAKSLAASIGGVAAVYKLDPATNAYTTYWLPDMGLGTNFPITPGMACLVNLKSDAPSTWFMVGSVPYPGSVRFTLAKTKTRTYNEISVPLDRLTLTNAAQLAASIGGVEALYRIDPATNAFTQYWLVAQGLGTNFPLNPGEPVLLLVNQSAPNQWPAGSMTAALPVGEQPAGAKEE